MLVIVTLDFKEPTSVGTLASDVVHGRFEIAKVGLTEAVNENILGSGNTTSTHSSCVISVANT